MKPTELARAVADGLCAAPGRSLLGIAAAAIGVASMLGALAVGHGATANVTARIEGLGARLILVEPARPTGTALRLARDPDYHLKLNDARRLTSALPSGTVVAPLIYGTAHARLGDRGAQTIVQGVTEDYLAARDWPPVRGRGIQPVDVAAAAKVAVLGQNVAVALFGAHADPLGAVIRVNAAPLVVVGVLAPKGPSPEGRDQDDTILVPLPTARLAVLGRHPATFQRIPMILVKSTPEAAMAETVERVRNTLLAVRRTSDARSPVNVRPLAQVHAARREAAANLRLLLMAIGGITLAAGLANVAMVMGMAVRARFHEIALRRVAGARRGDIRDQFLAEAATLSITGGLIGLGLGVAFAHLFGRFTNWPVAIDLAVIGVALLATIGGGILCALWPARRAARIDPVYVLSRQ